jgi:hypothetical protein
MMDRITRRKFFKKVGLLAAVAAVPAPVVKALESQLLAVTVATPISIHKRFRHAVALRMTEVKSNPGAVVRAKRMLLEWGKQTCLAARRRPKKIEFMEQLCDYDLELGVVISIELED